MERFTTDPRNNESAARFLTEAAEIRRSCAIDRSETCFKGKGTVTKKDLNPNPLELEQMQTRLIW